MSRNISELIARGTAKKTCQLPALFVDIQKYETAGLFPDKII
jgi:hypothetical protein